LFSLWQSSLQLIVAIVRSDKHLAIDTIDHLLRSCEFFSLTIDAITQTYEVFVIKLADWCIHANFVAVKQFACLQSSSRPASIIHTTIGTVELAHSQSSS
jgi:hypothetical protein